MSYVSKDASVKRQAEQPKVTKDAKVTGRGASIELEDVDALKLVEPLKSIELSKSAELPRSPESKKSVPLPEPVEPAIVTQRFVERKAKVQDPNAYARDRDEPGLVIIMNQTFSTDITKKREGTEYDVAELVTTFSRLGYNIDKEYIRSDLSKKEIEQLLENLLSDDKKTNCNCVIFVFLTHGTDNNILETSDGYIGVESIWQSFNACQNLQGKPKLFLIQACKGDSRTMVDAVDSDVAMPYLVPTNVFTTAPPDILSVFATKEGTVSFRDTSRGSWFIQEFCKNALLYGKTEDVVSIVQRTAKCVANTYYAEDEDNEDVINKQMPTSILTLRRKFYLTTSNEHQRLLEELKEKDEIIAQLKELTNNKIAN